MRIEHGTVTKTICPFCGEKLAAEVTKCNDCGAERRDDELSQFGLLIIFISICSAVMVGVVSQSFISFIVSFLLLFIVFGLCFRSMMFTSKREWRMGSKKKPGGLRRV